MKMHARILVGFLAISFLSIVCMQVWSARKKPEKPENIVVLKDVAYVPGSLNPFQFLDLYLPSLPSPSAAVAKSAGEIAPLVSPSSPSASLSSKLHPVIVWIHGGAWMAGDKNHPPAVDYLIAKGYAVASLNYRLTDRAQHPAQINDCKAAIRFLRAHATEYGLDPNRIGVWGHSAGGHLVALLGTSGDVKELEGELGNNNFSSRVQAVVDWCGPTNLLSIASQAGPKNQIDFKSPTNPVAVLMGAGVSPAAYLTASPIQYVSADDPPMMIVHAEDDDVVPVAQSRELLASLKKAGVETRDRIPSNGGHALSNRVYVEESIEFLDKHLKPEPN